ncbi:HAD family hydrolase [Actinopolymorpha alba]|uniref:HAD family hydrolase n=1 Tax=Actinopolymorpha alba TaxID=533267 RepID=UPI00037A1055|nr:HAD family hydrolase [Actinopolymorpha alba]
MPAEGYRSPSELSEPGSPGAPIRALIFDFDGLILDTEVPEFESWQAIFSAHDSVLRLEVWAQCIGSSDHGWDPYAHLEREYGKPVDRAVIKAARRAHCDQLIAAQTVLPGVEAYIHEARRRGLKVGLASSSSRRWVDGHLQRLRLHTYFDAIRTSDDVARTKPDPELYRVAAAALGVHPAQAIALEDSPNGVAAAKAAGLFCVAVPNQMTRQLPLDAADLRLPSMDAMPLNDVLFAAARANGHGSAAANTAGGAGDVVPE